MPDHHHEIIEIDGWHFRVQHPKENTSSPRLMLLLHGYQGNENSMWLLTNPLADDYLMIAPRAPIESAENQYVWHEIKPQWPDIGVYQQLADQLLTRVDLWLEKQMIPAKTFDLMGFSQGAVMAYALAFLRPERINRVSALAGFIPHSWKAQVNMGNIKDKPFFIAHGIRDEIIPISKAYQAAGWLKEFGAHITFCEADIGHKLGANCFKGLGDFFG
ncbi:MAG: hypothetical protein GX142_03120 [Chloroflexi bacterium]|jgi:phospholipase/carboxylesterase|nr:hypothetical protein [Chloroflexota bacterium]